MPRCDPPFDDELEPHVWAAGAHQLALDWPPGPAPVRPATSPPTPEMAAALRGVTPHPFMPGTAAALQGEAPPSPVPGTAAALQSGAPQPHTPGTAAALHGVALQPAGAAGASGDAKLAVRRFVHLCVEVLNGYRPAAHLRRLALPKEAAGVVAQAVAGTSRVAELRRQACPGQRRDRRPGPVGVIRLRLCEPRPGAVEAAVLLVTGERTWAMALRLELHQQNWCATTLRLV